MAISLAGNLITLTGSGSSPAGGTSWANAYDMEDVLSACGGVVTKQGANAYDVSARLKFETGVYFVSKNEFVELKPNPINPTYAFLINAGAHVKFGEYDSGNGYSENGAFWRVYLNGTTNQQNLVWGEFLVYGSNVWTDAGNYNKGIHGKAGATIRYYNSIFKDKAYFWAPNTNLQDVKWIGGTGTYDMLFATGYDYSFSGVTSINCNYGLFFSSTTNAPVDVYNQKFQGCTYDVGNISTNHLIRVINSPFTTYYPVASGRTGFKECYEFNIKVTNDQGSPIVGATVSLKDVDGTDAFTPEETIVGGVLAVDKVVVRKWFRHANQGGIKDYNNHTLKVTSGSDESEYKIKIDHQMSEDVVLLPQSVASYDNIMTGINDIKGTGFLKDTDSLVDIRPESDKIQTILIDTNELQSNQGAWATATGFATQNPPSQILNDYKANVTNLDVAVSTRNAVIPPTTGEIKTELEGVGTKLTLVKTTIDKLNFTGTDIKATLDNEEVTTNIASRNASKADISGIPTNPLLTTDIRLNNLDTTISSRADQNPPSQVLNDYKATGFATQNPPSQNLNDYKATGFAVPNEYDSELVAIQADLNIPNQYKADVSGLGVSGEYDARLTALQTKVNGLNGEAMRGTDGANVTIPPTTTEMAGQVWNSQSKDFIATGTTGDNLRSINVTAGNPWWVDVTLGSDINTGTTRADPFATIGKALLEAAPGDVIYTKAGVYDEIALDINKAGVKLCGDLGTTIRDTVTPGPCLKVSADNCGVSGCWLHPTTPQIGLHFTGNNGHVELCGASECSIGYKIEGYGTDFMYVKSLFHSITGFDISGSKLTFVNAYALGSGVNCRGFYLSASGASYNLFHPVVAAHNNITDFECVVDANDNSFIDYASDNIVIDNGNNNHWTKSHSPGDTWDGLISAHTSVNSFGETINFLREIEGGRWELVGTQHVYYAKDNVTEIAKFNLYDKNGVLCSDPTKIVERRRV